ncbi:subtilisin-like protease SBT4.3 [Zingiber officinale]|uniref:subtilisin-like protease SBT4.3 n=1 Tax=Zingiber officinale TaxID=94328 RepID=UPI001C4A79B8|nr:subtilisin-like protease SBT4.3 [Zingiber officinale]
MVIMSSRNSLCMLPLLAFAALLIASAAAEANGERKVYVVYMGHQPPPPSTAQGWFAEAKYLSILDQVLEGCSSRESLVYSYTSFAGLAANLTEKEKGKLAGVEGVVSVFESKILKPLTTRSWDFLGFYQNVRRVPASESDVVVGMIDTGIWPESEAFSDEGFGPPPPKWKGGCVNFVCNNKVIGARYYNQFGGGGYEATPRDFEGHGTHTASTAAGREVPASLYGVAGGVARGAVPSARVAVYKVCWSFGCFGADILAAFDDAIADGVDVISASLGGYSADDYFEDPIAIGAFHAMKKGILTSAAGGNAGPGRGTVSNVAPWMLVSAASSTDRHIIDKLILKNSNYIVGASINTFGSDKKLYPITYFGNASSPSCDQLEAKMVKGKIVVCGQMTDGSGPLNAGAKGAIIFFNLTDFSIAFPLPALVVNSTVGDQLIQYIDSNRNVLADIRKSEAVHDSKAPVVGSFSSRGPNTITPAILKPDLSAPGIDILAAWSGAASMSLYQYDPRRVNYNIISGTSMACPHVTGAAAYVKSFHPQWSPAAIMSALITTASPMNPSLHPDAELAYGSGQVNPVAARDPGLIYDAAEADYVKMLCDQGYNETQIQLITGDLSSCPGTKLGSPGDLNYPSMAYYVPPNQSFAAGFNRTVTNVGDAATARYAATVNAGGGLRVTVTPGVLRFRRLNEQKKFEVTVWGGPLEVNGIVSAYVTWSDGKHRVRSVVTVFTDYSKD